MIDGEENKDNKKLFFLGKHKIENFEKNFDDFYDRYKKAAQDNGFTGDLKFVTSYKMVWIYVIIQE